MNNYLIKKALSHWPFQKVVGLWPQNRPQRSKQNFTECDQRSHLEDKSHKIPNTELYATKILFLYLSQCTTTAIYIYQIACKWSTKCTILVLGN